MQVTNWYSWVDSNHRPPDPQSGALTKLSYSCTGPRSASARKLCGSPWFGKTDGKTGSKTGGKVGGKTAPTAGKTTSKSPGMIPGFAHLATGWQNANAPIS